MRRYKYSAAGGEAFALLLPVLYPLISAVVRDYIEDAKTGFKHILQLHNKGRFPLPDECGLAGKAEKKTAL